MFAELKDCFMEAYDDNKDGKIDIREVSTFLKHWLKKLIFIVEKINIFIFFIVQKIIFLFKIIP